jgi:hypothetical protein
MAANRTAIGVFTDPRRGQQAIEELHRTGFLEEQIRILGEGDSRSNPSQALRDLTDEEALRLERLRRAGRTVIAVRGKDCYYEVLAILCRHGAEPA